MSTMLVADVVAQVAQGHLHDAVGVPRPGALGVLGGGHAEEDHAGDAEGGQLGDLLAQRLAGVLHDAGQRGDRLGLVDALAHEQRGDQVVGRQAGLGHQPAQGRGAAQPAQAALGEAHPASLRSTPHPGRLARAPTGAERVPPAAPVAPPEGQVHRDGSGRRAARAARSTSASESTTRSAWGNSGTPGHLVGDHHAGEPGGAGGGGAVVRVLEGDAPPRIDAEGHGGRQVHVGRRLRQGHVVAAPTALKRSSSPSRSRWGSTQSSVELDATATGTPAASASSSRRDHARAHLLLGDQRVVGHHPPGPHLVHLDRAGRHLGQPRRPVPVVGPPHAVAPLVELELEAVHRELVADGGELGPLGVEDQPVEVEHDRCDLHRGTLVRRSRRRRSSSRARRPGRRCVLDRLDRDRQPVGPDRGRGDRPDPGDDRGHARRRRRPRRSGRPSTTT